MNKKIGCLWLKKGENVGQYFSGVLEDMRGEFQIVVFPNKKKEKETHPHFIIYVSESKEKKDEYTGASLPVVEEPTNSSETDIGVEDIPM